MDLVRSFRDVGLSNGVEINIHGTPEEPLFQANQVGELLGMTNVRMTIKDFDRDEKGVSRVYTPGGSQQVMCLTELGLYRLLGLSRKPFARPFQKWVAMVLKEIRLNGKFELEQQLQKTIADSEARAQLTTQEHETALALAAKDKDDALAAKDAELAAFRSKTYEELPRLDTIYVNKEIAELSTNTHKIGRSIDAKKREAQLNTGSAQGSRMIYTRSTHNAKIVEDMCRVALKRYHIATLGGVEHYSCSIDHSVDVIDLACTVMDTMASSFEYITRDNLLRRVRDKIDDMLDTLDEDDSSVDDDMGNEDTSHVHRGTSLAATSHVRRFLSLGPEDEDAVVGFEVVYTVRDPEAGTAVAAFQSAYSGYMKERHASVRSPEVLDKKTLEMLGFVVEEKNVCKACLGWVVSPRKCCSAYARLNRKKILVAVGLLLVRKCLDDAEDDDALSS